MKTRYLLTVWLLAASLLPAAPAGASHLNQQQGKVLAGIGLGVQVVNLGLALVSLGDINNAFYTRFVIEAASPAFVPMTIAGFEAALSDGSPAGQLRAAGTGCLELSLYAWVMAGVSAINMATHRAYMNYRCNTLGQNSYCYGDSGDMYIVGRIIAYANVALVMLIPGIDLTVRSRKASTEPDPTHDVDHPLTLNVGPGGLLLSGQF